MLRSIRLILAATLAVAVLLLAAAPASAARVRLVASEPQAQQTVDDEPGWVTVALSSPVDASVAKIVVIGPDGDNVTTGDLIVEDTNVTTQLRDELPQGTYTVHYRVNGSGDDVAGGAFQFAYVEGTFSSLPDRSWSGSAHEPAILRGSDPNATTEPPKNGPKTTPPDVEVQKSDGGAETVDPGPTATTHAGHAGTGGGTATDQPTHEPGATSTASGGTTSVFTASRLPYVVGGAVLLIAIAVGGVAIGLRGRGRGGGPGGGSE